MKIIILGDDSQANELLEKVNFSIEDLGLGDFISSEITTNEDLKTELNISKSPALIIEEESIDFKDMIFEGIIPSSDEIKSMLVSIIGGGEGSSCESGSCSSGGCSTCSH